MEHPFADGAKLKILNAKYTVPDDPKNVSDLQPLIGRLNFFVLINSYGFTITVTSQY